MENSIRNEKGHYYCIKCEKRYASIQAFETHMQMLNPSSLKVCSSEGLYECMTCGTYYKSVTGVTNHCRNLVRCYKCGRQVHGEDLFKHWQWACPGIGMNKQVLTNDSPIIH